MRKHIAVFKKIEIEKLLGGEKTSDLRSSKKKIDPYLQLSKGDLVYIKEDRGEVIGQFIVKKAIFFEGVDQETITLLKEKYGLEVKESNQYLTLIFIEKLEQFITSPIEIDKRNKKPWIILED